MWNKSDGGGILEGAHARMLRVAVAEYVESMRGSECWDDDPRDQGRIDETRLTWLDVAQVARMDHGQRLHMIATVVKALTDSAVPAPDLTADTEATVYQVYQFLCHATDIEYDMLADVQADPDEEYDPALERLLVSTRGAIAAAVRESGLCLGEGPDPCGRRPPDMDANPETWHGIVDALADTVLWDRDWEMEASLGDADPETSAAVRVAAGIEEGYFTIPAQEPTLQQVASAKAYLESIADEMRSATAGCDG